VFGFRAPLGIIFCLRSCFGRFCPREADVFCEPRTLSWKIGSRCLKVPLCLFLAVLPRYFISRFLETFSWGPFRDLLSASFRPRSSTAWFTCQTVVIDVGKSLSAVEYYWVGSPWLSGEGRICLFSFFPRREVCLLGRLLCAVKRAAWWLTRSRFRPLPCLAFFVLPGSPSASMQEGR